VGVTEGEVVGLVGPGVSSQNGAQVGVAEGEVVGGLVGGKVGIFVGKPEGKGVGRLVGGTRGAKVGIIVGLILGTTVGEVGLKVGILVDEVVGDWDGMAVGVWVSSEPRIHRFRRDPDGNIEVFREADKSIGEQVDKLCISITTLS